MAKKALVSFSEPRENGYRIAQVEESDNTFETNSSLEWHDCADDVLADHHWYDPNTSSIRPLSYMTPFPDEELAVDADGVFLEEWTWDSDNDQWIKSTITVE